MNLTPDERRIRAALEQIETPMYDITAAVQEQRARRGRRLLIRSPQRILAAVLAGILLTMTAAAAVMQFSGGWHSIFGNGVAVPEGITLPLQNSQTVNGCTVTLEDAIVSSSNVAVIFSVIQEQSPPLAAPIDFGEILLSINGGEAQTPVTSQSVFNPDTPAVQYCYQEYEYDGGSDEIGLTFTVNPLACMQSSEPLTAEIDLGALYQAYPLVFPAGTENDTRTAAYAAQDFSDVELPLADPASAITLAGMALSGDDLCLAISFPMDDVSVELTSLLDTRTGTCIPSESGSTSGSSASNLQLHESVFPDVGVDDLPYLQPQVVSTLPVQLTDQPLTFSSRAETSAAYERSVNLHLPDGTEINAISVTPTCVQLKGEHPDAPDWEAPSVMVQLQDGSSLAATPCTTTLYSSDGSGLVAFDISYEYQSPEHYRQFLSVEDAAFVRIDDITIKIDE